MEYHERRLEACKKLYSGFEPDFSGCRNLPQAEKILELSKLGLFSHDIAKIVGKSPKSIQKFWRRYHFPLLQNFEPPRREQRRGWNGGVKEVKGYLYSRQPSHPHASKHGSYVAVHRLVMEEKLGRLLLRTEVVDHIDGNTRNNSPDNLRVFQSNAEHLQATLAGKRPKWSDDGWNRILKGAAKGRESLAKSSRDTEPSRVESESDAHLSQK